MTHGTGATEQAVTLVATSFPLRTYVENAQGNACIEDPLQLGKMPIGRGLRLGCGSSRAECATWTRRIGTGCTENCSSRHSCPCSFRRLSHIN